MIRSASAGVWHCYWSSSSSGPSPAHGTGSGAAADGHMRARNSGTPQTSSTIKSIRIIIRVFKWFLLFQSFQDNFPMYGVVQCTTGDEGPVADISCMNIFSHFQGLLTTVQLPATKLSAQIWISCWILPHFDVILSIKTVFHWNIYSFILLTCVYHLKTLYKSLMLLCLTQ